MARYLGKVVTESLIGHVSVCEEANNILGFSSGWLTCHRHCAVTGIAGAADL